MDFLGINVLLENIPSLDKGFIPLSKFNMEFLKTAKSPLAIAIERDNALISVYETYIHGTDTMYAADCYYIERLVKTLLWTRGGYRVYVCGDEKIGEFIKGIYDTTGKRAFDNKFMARVYEKDFEIICLNYDKRPAANELSKSIGGHLEGCRIGFDAGGSDRKVSAVIDGKVIYSEEVVWFPKINEDPDYHFDEIVKAFQSAAERLPRVDAIGISSAGIYINNLTRVASLFLKVPEELFNEKVKDIYLRAAKVIGDIPVEVANDGDITALAGAMELNDTNVLGIAMGTSEAAGYIDDEGNITGWLNELAFVPVDCQTEALMDEWSGDIGCGVKYFSQDAVIKLATVAGITFVENLSPADKLKEVQKLLEDNQPAAIKIYESIGCYLGHSLSLYSDIYNFKHILLLGRVMSGEGGNIIVRVAKQVLRSEYPTLCDKIKVHLPDEDNRRVGQSIAAASLPTVN